MLPTLCEVAGVEPPAGGNLCGHSYAYIALNKKRKEPWRNVVFGQFRYAETARDTRYKLVLRHEGQGPNELYDLSEDPRERINQYDNAQFLSVKERLTKRD